MRRRQQEPPAPQQQTGQGMQPDPNAPATGSTTGATSTGLRDDQTYQQQGYPQQQGAPQQGYQQQGRGTQAQVADRPEGRRDTAYAPERGRAGYERDTSASSQGGGLAILAGVLSFLAGLALITRSHFYHQVTGYYYNWSVHSWGIVMLVLGAVLFATGVAALLRLPFARYVAAGVAVLTAIAGFLFLIYSPFWGIIIVAASAFAVWSLLRTERTRSSW
jgi:hypothetical protein